MDNDRLQTIKENIEIMSKCYQIEILNLLNNESSVMISENNNGTFINLTNLDITIINKLESYIQYVNKQQNQLLDVENEKTNIKNEFFAQEKYNSRNTKNKRVTNKEVNNKEINNIILDAK